MIRFMREQDRKIYFAGLKVLAKDLKIRQGDFAKKLKVDQTTISNYMNCKTRPPDEAFDVFEKMVKKTREQIMEEGRQVLGMSGTQTTPNHITYTRRSTDTNNVTTMSEHQIMVTRFKDQARGKYLNELLLEIEELDPGELDEVAETLQAKLRKLRRRKSPEPSPQVKSSAS